MPLDEQQAMLHPQQSLSITELAWDHRHPHRCPFGFMWQYVLLLRLYDALANSPKAC